MKLSERVGPHLPYLRRFARALTGSQKSGDAYVAALLESIVSDPSMVKESHNLRVDLYHGLCAMWGSLSVNERPDNGQPAWEATIQGRLINISGRARQVYLLRAVEGFEFEDIAQIQGRGAAAGSFIGGISFRKLLILLGDDKTRRKW